MKRRGVAGLISLIAILFVVSLGIIAFLQFNSQQTSLSLVQTAVSEINHQRTMENLDFTITSCTKANSTHTAEIRFNVTNNAGQSSYLDSMLLVYLNIDGNFTVTDAIYLPQDVFVFPNTEPIIEPLSNNKQGVINQPLKFNNTIGQAERVIFTTNIANNFGITNYPFYLNCS